ncbi:hypothetical protein [Pseudanabaena sp. FACHB-2040]|nr:hypothetical protein [Pseudanabaena sp. FACHB-2040]MBD2256396.1 hypothetical protein [Pseudanabaena sp. FACHB-2040]
MIPAQQPPSAAEPLTCPKPVLNALASSFTPYRDALSPWCIVRLLP